MGGPKGNSFLGHGVAEKSKNASRRAFSAFSAVPWRGKSFLNFLQFSCVQIKYQPFATKFRQICLKIARKRVFGLSAAPKSLKMMKKQFSINLRGRVLTCCLNASHSGSVTWHLPPKNCRKIVYFTSGALSGLFNRCQAIFLLLPAPQPDLPPIFLLIPAVYFHLLHFQAPLQAFSHSSARFLSNFFPFLAVFLASIA